MVPTVARVLELNLLDLKIFCVEVALRDCLNGCETRPVKGDPPTPGASLAASAVTKTPMRRHASEWAVGCTATQ